MTAGRNKAGEEQGTTKYIYVAKEEALPLAGTGALGLIIDN